MDATNFERVYNDYINQSEQQAMAELNNSTSNTSSTQDSIQAVRKNDDGDIIAFKMKSGRELDYVTALNEAKDGLIAHVDVFHKYGRDIIRSEPDGIKENNLDNLPTF